MSGYNRRGRNRSYGRNYNNDKSKKNFDEKGHETLTAVNENCLTLKIFKQYCIELDTKHDKYERIVKISRDITIESKRIIFLLHNVDRENKRDDILKEAEERLSILVSVSFKNIALELENQDPYQFFRAYSAGLQEYIEALTFFQYLKTKSIENWDSLEKQMTYVVSGQDKKENIKTLIETETDEITNSDLKDNYEIRTLIPPTEFILGLADLTGELMRKCINSLGSGNTDECFQTCEFVKTIYRGFLTIGNLQNRKEMFRKTYVLKQSLSKMELVCYNIIVRGSEVPKHTLAHVFTTTNSEEDIFEDEGYF